MGMFTAAVSAPVVSARMELPFSIASPAPLCLGLVAAAERTAQQRSVRQPLLNAAGTAPGLASRLGVGKKLGGGSPAARSPAGQCFPGAAGQAAVPCSPEQGGFAGPGAEPAAPGLGQKPPEPAGHRRAGQRGRECGSCGAFAAQEGPGSVARRGEDTRRASGLEFFNYFFLIYGLKIGILTLVWTLYPMQSPLQPPGSPANADGTVKICGPGWELVALGALAGSDGG